MKKDNVTLIIIAVIIGVFIFTQGGQGLFAAVTTTEANCENVRQIKINEGNLCVGECRPVTQELLDCTGNNYQLHLHGFYYSSRACDQLFPTEQEDYNCWYPGGSTCTDTSWSPSPSSVCQGDSFTQTSNCGNTRSAIGTMDCSSNTCTMADVVAQGPVSRTALGQAIQSWVSG